MIDLTYYFGDREDLKNKSNNFAINLNDSMSVYIPNKNLDWNNDNGRLFEEAGSIILGRYVSNMGSLDYSIRKGGSKDWSPDQEANHYKFQYKSMTAEQAAAYGESFLLEWGSHERNSLGSHPREGKIPGLYAGWDKEVFDNTDPYHYIVSGIVDRAKQLVTIRSVVQVDWLLQKNLWKLPKKYLTILKNYKRLSDEDFYDALRSDYTKKENGKLIPQKEAHTKVVVYYEDIAKFPGEIIQLPELKKLL